MKVLSVDYDEVVRSTFITASTTYEYAIDKLVPLIGRLEIQRELQSYKFYERLAKDIVKGCIMPPLTIAIIDSDPPTADVAAIGDYIDENIGNFFILDGMQRLNTIRRAAADSVGDFPLNRPLFVNALICKSMDLLLYRMITLNNGQKPMTARHQIEIIASNVYDFEESDIPLQAEKRKPGQKRLRGAFKKVDLIKAYLAFLTGSVNIDNEKIIQEKMDELIATKIMDSDLGESESEFDDVVDLISAWTANERIKNWLLVQNNLIGFSAGAKKGLPALNTCSPADFMSSVEVFEKAFSGIDVSKIRLGMARRKAVEHFIQNYSKLSILDDSELLDTISCVI
ncbi:hypothetical protein GCM10025771_10070 [Niveibacterium umoris]|uniref:DUF262 domain-containing protein n=1 Tax=Niveibacterium umoris TaxID=1193620 RepID=A0A840BLE9_9RHOO|nr:MULTISPECIES: hypothetical protein [Niveibacterium]MBB4013443.1 hypothetical protein [Niveibacterium umoris]